MLDSYFKERNVRDLVDLQYFTREPEPAGEEHMPSVWMDAQSKKRNVTIHYDFTVQAIDAEKKRVRDFTATSCPTTCCSWCRRTAPPVASTTVDSRRERPASR